MIRFLFFLFFFCFHVQSQEIITSTLLRPESKEISDFSFLKKELKNKNVVLLGEMTHRYGNIFEMKARLIEYLHKELGYTTIAIESPMYDLWKASQNRLDINTLNKSIWDVWSDSKEFQRLSKYIIDNKLKVIGFDSQVINTRSFIDDFFKYCKKNKVLLKLNEDDLGIVFEGVLENVSYGSEDIDFPEYEKELNRIVNQILKLQKTKENNYWLQLIKSLIACSKDAYYNQEPLLSSYYADEQHNFRDEQMADNLLNYINRNPNEKIICWADNIHIVKSLKGIKDSIIKKFTPMGQFVHDSLKNKMYSIASLHSNDSLFDGKIWHQTPILYGSFEDKLRRLGSPYLFISSNQESLKVPMTSRLLNFSEFVKTPLNQLFDGYIYFRNATAPENELQYLSTRKNPKTKSINKTKESAESIMYDLQVIDMETKKPIPYADIILENLEIYRMADENGKLKIKIPLNNSENDVLMVKSMGYEEKKVLFNKITSKLELAPKYELLDEIVLYGTMTPRAILKKAVEQLKDNYPLQSFNFSRYAQVIINNNDQTTLDIELITQDYDQGYSSPFIITQRGEQVKWNKNVFSERNRYYSDFFAYRQNSIRYSNILHKRKYKKFKLNFVESEDEKYPNAYIISFSTDRKGWNYTNRGYSTSYFGKLYIDKTDYAILEINEVWETTLFQPEISKFWAGYKRYDEIKEMKIKEENTCKYKKHEDKKYYASNYYRKYYTESINNKNELSNSLLETNSSVFNIIKQGVEEIKYEEYIKSKINDVQYDSEFWTTFYESKQIRNN